MKYFFITASMVGGGTERVISILANQFAKEGHDVTILMTADDRLDYALENTVNCELITTSTQGSLIKRFGRIIKIRNVFKKNREAVFYSFGTETNLFSILASMGLNSNLILSERNDPNQCSYSKLRDMVYFGGKRFVFQTESAKQCFSCRIQKRSVVISNPIRDDLPDAFTGIRKKTVVAVGRLERQKNHKLLITAFSKFLTEFPEYELKIYGQGPLKAELQELIEKSQLTGKIHLMGFSKNVLEEIKEDGMYVLSSDYEGVPNSLLEAMGIGMPVIATDCPIGGPDSLIEDGSNGVLVPVGNELVMYEAMCRFARDAMFAEACGKNALLVRDTNKTENIVKLWAQCAM